MQWKILKQNQGPKKVINKSLWLLYYKYNLLNFNFSILILLQIYLYNLNGYAWKPSLLIHFVFIIRPLIMMY